MAESALARSVPHYSGTAVVIGSVIVLVWLASILVVPRLRALRGRRSSAPRWPRRRR